MLQEAPRFIDSPEDRFKRGEIGAETYNELIASTQDVKTIIQPKVRKGGSWFVAPEDLTRGGWVPSQRDIAYFVGRRPVGQQATFEDLMGMSSIDISRRADLIKISFFGKLGSVLIKPSSLVSEGLARFSSEPMTISGSIPRN